MNDQENDTPVFWLTTGPVAAYPQVSQGLSRPVLYDDDPVFRVRYETLTQKLRTALRTSTTPVIMQGEPVLGLEAAAASLIARHDIVLNLVSGVYGDGYGYWARRYCSELVEIRVPYNEVIDPAQVEAVLASRPDITIVSMCHHDTPSGTINPAVEIGRVVAAHGGFLVIDAVSSFGGMNIHPEDCAADIFVTAPQKCLGCPPGLTIMSVTDRAWAKMHANPLAPRASFLSIIDFKNRRPMLFTADACYSKKSMDMMCISSFHLDPTASLNSMKRLKTLAETHDAELFYSHDLESFKTYRTEADYYS